MAIRVTAAAERAIRDGHPWVFENSIRDQSRRGEAGDVAVVFDRKNRFLAAGLLDPAETICARMLTIGTTATIGTEFFESRLDDAWSRRTGVTGDEHTTGFRLVNGEGDQLSGLIVDIYGDTAVAKLYTAAWFPHLDALLEALDRVLATKHPIVRTVVLVSRRLARDPETPPRLKQPLVLGAELEAGKGVRFLEHGLHLEAHPLEGHKTGFYLDQRENRRRVRGLGSGLEVLNLFSYSGGFSLAAAAGGARGVTSVDLAEPALTQAREHFRLNDAHPKVSAAQHRTLQGDAFETLEQMALAGESWDMVIVDPPSFAKEASQTRGAIRAYERLTTMSLGVLRRGGLLLQCSCSSRVDPDEFAQAVHRAAQRAGRPLEELDQMGHAEDHPIGIPENLYLKALLARVP